MPPIRGLRAARAPRMLPGYMGNALTARSPRNHEKKHETGMQLTGLVAGMDIHYAGCCHPCRAINVGIVCHRQRGDGACTGLRPAGNICQHPGTLH